MKPTRIKLTGDLELSRIVHGHWRSAEWKLSDQQMLSLTEQAVELGVNTFDHADIYGDYTCEKRFGDALRLKEGLRNHIRIVTKCGIKLVSEKYPERRIKYYDYGFEHIVNSAENSLRNFHTDRIDLLLLHRPAPFLDPEAVAKAFYYLRSSGKVLHFGVSNFSPEQFAMLNAYTEEPLVTNQVEISPYCLHHFENGNMDFFLKEKIRPMAWSPLTGGRLLSPGDPKSARINQTLEEIASEMNAPSVETVIFTWLLKHPASIIPVTGTGKIERIRLAVDALHTDMSLEQWYRIYTASTGVAVP